MGASKSGLYQAVTGERSVCGRKSLRPRYLTLKLILEFCQQASGEAGPLQMQANLVERIIGRTRLRAPIHGAHDDMIRIPQEKFRVDLGILHGNQIDHAI